MSVVPRDLVQDASLDAYVELFDLDLSPLGQSTVLRFVAGVSATSLIDVTNEGGSAGNRNSFGWYVKDAAGLPTWGKVVWANVNVVGNNPTQVGDKFTVNFVALGVGANDVGYFLIPNGGGQEDSFGHTGPFLNPTLVNDQQVVFFQDTANADFTSPWTAAIDENLSKAYEAGTDTVVVGEQAAFGGAPAFFSDRALNPDSQSDHVLSQTPPGVTPAFPGNQHWEDLTTSTSFNDVNVTVEAALLWRGNSYAPVDVEVEGFELSARGPLPRPTLRVGNANRVFTSAINDVDDLVGALVTRWRTLLRFLDGQVDADPDAHFPVEVYNVNRKVSQNKVFVEWELASAIDQQSRMIPGRQVLRDTCTHRYRLWDGAAFDYTNVTCPYVGRDGRTPDIAGPYFKPDTQLTTLPENDLCGKRYTDCQVRFLDQPLPTRAFPAVSKTRT